MGEAREGFGKVVLVGMETNIFHVGENLILTGDMITVRSYVFSSACEYIIP